MNLLRSLRVWLGILFIGLLIALRYSGVGEYISLESVQNQREHLILFVQSQYWLSVLTYIGLYIAIVASALPLAALCTVVGGFLFGILPSVLYTNIGATIGATIFFLMVRYAFGSSVQRHYQDKLAWFNEQMDRYGISYLIAIHFVAVIPFFIMNLLIGLTRVSLWTFIWTTSIGVLPGTFVYAFAGSQLATVHTLQDIFSFKILLAFGLLLLLALVPIAVQHYRRWGIE